jgi:hypothetical protein
MLHIKIVQGAAPSPAEARALVDYLIGVNITEFSDIGPVVDAFAPGLYLFLATDVIGDTRVRFLSSTFQYS